MQKLISYFFSGYNLKFQTLWLKRLLYLFLILKTLSWLVYYDLFFGNNSIVFASPSFVNPLKDFAFVLYNYSGSNLAYYFIIPVILLSLLSLLFLKTLPHWISTLSNILIWILVINIHNKIYPALTGGNYLLNQFLFFNCFLAATYNTGETWQNLLKICIHNFAVLAIMIQICLVYFLSALAKCADPAWLSGSALSSVMNVHHYYLYNKIEFLNNNFLILFLNYLVIFYQFSFPVLVFFKRIKKPFIVIGVLMHLYISFAMGLVEFGLIMILGYIYFWPFRKQVS